jgi:23S rRNA pseudouridine1911/1915/1917 synthase
VSEYVTVEFEQSGIELDELLALLYPALSKGYLRREVQAGHVLVDGEPCKPSRRLREGQVLILDIDEESAPVSPMEARAVELEVLYEDDQVLAVDKPAGLSSEPERWAPHKGSLAGSLLHHAASPERSEEFRPRLVHRLDKDTTGVVLSAKTLEAERHLRRLFEEGGIRKEYLALVEGEHPLADGEEELIDLPLAPDSKRGSRQRVADGGKESRTRVAVEERFRGYTLLRCRPLTGRTHQIRVHLAETGFPLAVDPLYGRREALLLSEIKTNYKRKSGRPERPLLGRLSLHAQRVEFPNTRGGLVAIESPFPADLVRTLKQLAKVRPYSR